MVNVVVSIISDKKTQPFIFNIATAGLFHFNKLPQKQDLEKVAHINCASIIFPYIRESLADLTRRAGLPPFHIDPVNFINIYEEQKKAEGKSCAIVMLWHAFSRISILLSYLSNAYGPIIGQQISASKESLSHFWGTRMFLSQPNILLTITPRA